MRLEKNKFTAGILLDLSKAFDTVNYSIIITKLRRCGIRGIALEWFKNYLTSRNQVVKFNNIVSSKEKITCGVISRLHFRPLTLFYLHE